jgi:ABC-2 type transport system ATP-binding protein
MIANVLEMRGVSKSFDRRLVLDELDFTIERGKIVGLLGRNGAGKSTLLDSALGLVGIGGGEISLLGENPAALSEVTRGRIGYVPQQTELFAWMTASQMLSYFKAFYEKWNDAKVAALLERWAIPREIKIQRMSAGEKQRLAIIRALAHEPDFLILDEPASSLDPAGRRDFLREVIDVVVDREVTVLFSTHILSDLERVAMDVSILSAGKIVLTAELDSLVGETFVATGSEQALASLERYGVEPFRREPGQLVARIPKAVQSSVETAGGEITLDSLSLEDFFIEVTK